MSKLADILLKPIGVVSASDKEIKIIRPTGEEIGYSNECCIYIGDRVKNTSDKSIALIINEREITLELMVSFKRLPNFKMRLLMARLLKS